MKYLLIFLPLFSLGQVKMNGYVTYLNTDAHVPDSVMYEANPHVKSAKRLPDFHGTPNLNQYYLHSGYDIGHFADADDMDYSKSTEYDSFDFVNVGPQKPNLNRITWRVLENYVRKLNIPVNVKVSHAGTLGKLGIVDIPAIYIKEIWYNGTYERYEMPNADTVTRHPFKWYRVYK